MQRELQWSAELGEDAGLLGLWLGMWGMAALSCGWTLWMHLPTAWTALAGLAAGIGAIGWFWRPSAFFLPGFLVIKGQRAHWQGQDHALAWVWLGDGLLGLMLDADSGPRRAIWITRRRVGTVAWWQLKRALALFPPTG
ncbi:hypothetical protein [Halothiobacillus sp. DCM-1]|uniref:hypothetical protein n=1 Tax=Halothiobacillus sp. DCM-1 TaxID=3112558 RepID=UPI0032433413